MPETVRRAAIVAALIPMLSACNGNVRSQNEVCRTADDTGPVRAATNAPATHGPGIVGGKPVQLRATGGWPHHTIDMHLSIKAFPMLYVFDDKALYAQRIGKATNAALGDPLFEESAGTAFWSEVVNDRYYELATFSSCSQTEWLGDDFNFRAPAGGLLFVQYVTPHCPGCERVSAAIQHTLDAHPDLPARWVQYDLASTTGKWCNAGLGFQPRDFISNYNIAVFTCP